MYKITYSDNSEYISGQDLNNSGWDKIDKPIKSLYYTLYGKKVYLEGFYNYIHLVYKANLISEQSKIYQVEIIASHPNYNIIATWDFKNKYFTVKKEHPDKLFSNLSGWKTGIKKIFPILKTN